ncbi:tetratricopeptide repeat protein [Massilia violaceinigra]|uniref:Tetratricopeptide repeat protein n=1 Tax=Massilia violaceinigra TaxID=2045208 RepID=A0ABY4A6R2_9BURK|nr:tetratricopeptide repeat protein [Massilia violaceinigra]UOD30468.1 tetratricopeptide repeat protein [Massilia violaceinigra]
MEIQRLTLPPRSGPGDVTTFYSFESASARSVALATMARLLAGRENATVPVLMIDFDTASPGLHHYFERRGERAGLLEYFQACRDQLRLLGRGHPARTPRGCAEDDAHAQDDVALARQVLEAVDWEPFVERVDLSRPLYLMRAGHFDDTYGERADQFDWDGLFQLCPALFRCFAEFMAQRFAHVLVDARSGRSAAVSICTTLLPRRLVTVFTPTQRSLDGLAGVVTRAIEYRCSHEQEQRPLLVYPLAAAIDSADSARRLLWRRGDPHKALAGYQSTIEQLLRQCYGVSRVSLDSYFDEVQLPELHAMAGAAQLAHGGERDSDRFSLTRTFDTLLDWFLGNYFPWQSHAEVRLASAIGAARERLGGGIDLALSLPLARDLHQLGMLQRGAGRAAEAIACFEESINLRQRLLGDDHADTRAGRAQLATLLRRDGRLAEAQFLHELLLDDCARLLGPEHPDTLMARAALAATVARRGDFGRALALHEQVIDASERLYGAAHMRTLDCLAEQARTLARHGEYSRARMVYERVLDGRERLLGSEHQDTLRCTQELATLLRELGDLGNARKLQEGVVAARERHAGPDHPATMQARELLAEIMAAQSDLAGVRAMLELLARSRERSLGAAHPDTLSSQLRLASTLSQQGDVDAARRLQQKLADCGAPGPAGAAPDPAGAAPASWPRAGQGAEAGPGPGRAAAPPGAPGASRLDAGARPTSILDAPPDSGGADTLSHKLAQLQELIDNCSEREARALADSLRKPVLRRNVPPPLRKRGMALIRQVYLRHNDKDALLAFAQDEVSFLQEALNDAVSGRPVSTQ